MGRYNNTLDEFLKCETGDTPYATPSVKSITLFELATHTSGLPAQPDDRHWPRKGGDNPFADYTQDDLCGSLLRTDGLPMRGKFVYSNIGFGLLGYLLELKMGKSYEDLCTEWVLEPLGMKHTKVSITEAEWNNMVAPGLDPKTGIGPVWRHSPYGVLQGNGAFHSTLADFGIFTNAFLSILERKDGPFSMSMARMFEVHAAPDCICLRDYCEDTVCDGSPNAWHGEVALAWQSFTHKMFAAWRKAGDTEGYSSNVVVLPGRGRAAFGFDTCGGCGSGGKQGSAIQRAVQILASGPPSQHETPSNFTSSELEELVGIYSAAQGVERTTLEVFLQQDDLFVQTRNGARVSDIVKAEAHVSPFEFSGEMRFSLERSVGSDGGGPEDKSSLTEVPQLRDLIFLKDRTNSALTVILHDGGQDTFYTRDEIGLVSV